MVNIFNINENQTRIDLQSKKKVGQRNKKTLVAFKLKGSSPSAIKLEDIKVSSQNNLTFKSMEKQKKPWQTGESQAEFYF